LAPSLRKLAYKNRRQDTFHSLQMHSEKQVGGTPLNISCAKKSRKKLCSPSKI
jgi:hypothetical protein